MATSCTINAFAVRDGYEDSQVLSYYFDVNAVSIYVEAAEAPYLYAWKGNYYEPEEMTIEWPGMLMTEKETVGGRTFWKQTFSATEPFNIIFDNATMNELGLFDQTKDILYITTDRYFTYDGISGYTDISEQYLDVPVVEIDNVAFSGIVDGWNWKEHEFTTIEKDRKYTYDLDLTGIAVEDNLFNFEIVVNDRVGLGNGEFTTDIPEYITGNGWYYQINLNEAPSRKFHVEVTWTGSKQFEKGWGLKVATIETVATPQMSRKDNVLTISTATQGATIYYTVDGTDPTRESARYENPITMTQNCTVKAFAVADGYEDSKVAMYVVNWFKVANVTFVKSGNQLTLSTATEGAVIHYTTDGSTPTHESAVYIEPLVLTQNCTVKAFAVKEGYTDSEMSALEITDIIPLAELTFDNVTMATETTGTITVTPIPANAVFDPTKVSLEIAEESAFPAEWQTIDLQRLSEQELQWNVEAYSIGRYNIQALYDGEPMGSSIVDVNQRLHLTDGWQWIALQGGQVSGSLEDVFGNQLEEARSETQMVVNDVQAGYWGMLQSMNSDQTYKVKMRDERVCDVSATAYGAMMLGDEGSSSLARSMHAGWNWIGNPYQYWQDLNTIFSDDSQFDEDDMVKFKSQFAVYANGQWQPNIYVEPGQGMLVYKHSEGQAKFNTEYSMEQRQSEPTQTRQMSHFTAGMWPVDESRFADNMAMVAYINSVSDPSAVTLLAFADGECRGRGIGVGTLQFITIHGQMGDKFTFKVLDHVTGELRQVAGEYPFTAMSGTVGNPVLLQAGSAITAIYNVYGDKTMADDAVYDLQGRCIDSSASQHLYKKGIYIQNRRKVVVR